MYSYTILGFSSLSTWVWSVVHLSCKACTTVQEGQFIKATRISYLSVIFQWFIITQEDIHVILATKPSQNVLHSQGVSKCKKKFNTCFSAECTLDLLGLYSYTSSWFYSGAGMSNMRVNEHNRHLLFGRIRKHLN